MDKVKQSIDNLNNSFDNFWDNYLEIPTYYKENELDFTTDLIKKQSHIILLSPVISNVERTSLGSTFNKRSEIIYNIKLYTQNQLGNIGHQAVLNNCLRFYHETQKEIQEALFRGSVSISGPIQDLIIKNYIISQASGTYIVNETVIN